MNQSHRDLLISALPADMQAGVLKACQAHSPDGNDVVEALFAADLETGKRGMENILSEFSRVHDKLATFEQREKRRDDQHVKERSEYLKAISQGYKELLGKTPLKHIIASKTIGAIIFSVMVAVVTPYVLKKQIGTVDPVFHERISTAESEIKKRIDDQAQLTNLRNDQLMDLVRENTDLIKKTHVTTAAQTLIGKSLYRYVEVGEKSMTVEVDGRRITVPHFLTPQEYGQLQLAIMAIKKAE
jgi:hypothetical protein